MTHYAIINFLNSPNTNTKNLDVVNSAGDNARPMNLQVQENIVHPSANALSGLRSPVIQNGEGGIQNLEQNRADDVGQRVENGIRGDLIGEGEIVIEDEVVAGAQISRLPSRANARLQRFN